MGGRESTGIIEIDKYEKFNKNMNNSWVTPGRYQSKRKKNSSKQISSKSLNNESWRDSSNS